MQMRQHFHEFIDANGMIMHDGAREPNESRLSQTTRCKMHPLARDGVGAENTRRRRDI